MEPNRGRNKIASKAAQEGNEHDGPGGHDFPNDPGKPPVLGQFQLGFLCFDEAAEEWGRFFILVL